MMATQSERFLPMADTPYTHCKTRIVHLGPLDLPESASDETYRQMYQDYIHSASADSNASLLRDAIESVKYGIAPPVAFPTETVYGLGADATNAFAVSGIFAAKGRPNDNPLIAHVSSLEHLQRAIGEPVPQVYNLVVEKFWPGPLTILLPVPKDSRFASNVHPGQNTIGIRMPSSKYARFFIAACDKPIAGPSANSSGKPSPTTAQHVMDDLKGKINFILDGGSCDVGVESTVVDGLHDPPLILRPGGVSLEELRCIGGDWANTAIGYKTHHSPSAPSTPSSDHYMEDSNGAPRAPGMKYRHYSPSARLILLNRSAVLDGRVEGYLATAMSFGHPSRRPKRVGMISWNVPYFFGIPFRPQPSISREDEEVIRDSHYAKCITVGDYGSGKDGRIVLFNVEIQSTITELAKELFGALRLFDELKCDLIFAKDAERENATVAASGPGELWDAVADRLGKASSERIDN